MAKTEGATEFIPTPEIIEVVKQLAYIGMSQNDIADKLGRCRDTLFHNNSEKYPEILLAYQQGKQSHKNKLLKDIDELGDDAKNEQVRFQAKKYQLAILHRVVEKQEVDLSATVNINIIKDYGTKTVS